jgi:soluble lytic murein transglycosylase
MNARIATRTAARPRARVRSRSRGRVRAVRRRRLAAAVLAGLLLVGAGVWLVAPLFEHAVREISLPLRHEDIIRQQAADKGLDPSLIAAIIYRESHFRDQTSAAGARGLMQLTPATARYIARKSGGTQFELGDLATPQINIAYGSFYLRYLLDKYGGNEMLALAAYNAGESNVDRWVADRSRAGGAFKSVAGIPFPETRAYVRRVLNARADYRARYARELGLR